MTKLVTAAMVAISALLSTVVATPAPAEAQAPTAAAVCLWITAAEMEPALGQNLNVIRATDFNLFGHFGVGCTVYPAVYVNSPRGFFCFVYDRNNGNKAFVNCPTPP